MILRLCVAPKEIGMTPQQFLAMVVMLAIVLVLAIAAVVLGVVSLPGLNDPVFVTAVFVPGDGAEALASGAAADVGLLEKLDIPSTIKVQSLRAPTTAQLQSADIVFGKLPTAQVKVMAQQAPGTVFLSTWSTAGPSSPNLFRLSNTDEALRSFWPDLVSQFGGSAVTVLYDPADAWSRLLARIINESGGEGVTMRERVNELSEGETYIVLRKDFVPTGSGARLVYGDFAAYMEVPDTEHEVYAVTSSPAGDDDMILSANQLGQQVSPSVAALQRCAAILAALPGRQGAVPQAIMERFGPGGSQWFGSNREAFARELQLVKRSDDGLWYRVTVFRAARKLQPLLVPEAGTLEMQMQVLMMAGPVSTVPEGALGRLLQTPSLSGEDHVRSGEYLYEVSGDEASQTWQLSVTCTHAATGESHTLLLPTPVSVLDHLELRTMALDEGSGLHLLLEVEGTNAVVRHVHAVTTSELHQVRTTDVVIDRAPTEFPLFYT